MYVRSQHCCFLAAVLLIVPSSNHADEPIQLEKCRKVDVPAVPDPKRLFDRGEAIQGNAEKPSVTTLRPRGSGAEIYSSVAPAVVMVKVPGGHGTGFFISANGWLITNNHVVEGAAFSREQKANVATVLFGTLGDDGWMQAPEIELEAVIYKVDERQDLALLKLTTLPERLDKVPFLRLADVLPRPGEDAVAIGHPGIGNMWSVRTGNITGTGNFPGDASEDIAQRTSLPEELQKLFREELESSGMQMRIYQSDLDIHPGDSGGPLCNKKGEVIGVTFALRGDHTTLTLHVHHAELADFTTELPDSPKALIPSAVIPLKVEQMYVDVNDDQRPDAVLGRLSEDGPVQSLEVTLAGSAVPATNDSQNDPAGVLDGNWTPHFSMYTIPQVTIAFDTDIDGTFDLIFRDEDSDNIADMSYEMINGDWVVTDNELSSVSEDVYSSELTKESFVPWLPEINSLLEVWKVGN